MPLFLSHINGLNIKTASPKTDRIAENGQVAAARALNCSRLHRNLYLEEQETTERHLNPCRTTHCQMPYTLAHSMHCLSPMRRQGDAQG